MSIETLPQEPEIQPEVQEEERTAFFQKLSAEAQDKLTPYEEYIQGLLEYVGYASAKIVHEAIERRLVKQFEEGGDAPLALGAGVAVQKEREFIAAAQTMFNLKTQKKEVQEWVEKNRAEVIRMTAEYLAKHFPVPEEVPAKGIGKILERVGGKKPNLNETPTEAYIRLLEKELKG